MRESQPIRISGPVKAGIIAAIVAIVVIVAIPGLFERVGKEQISALQAPISGKMTYLQP